MCEFCRCVDGGSDSDNGRCSMRREVRTGPHAITLGANRNEWRKDVEAARNLSSHWSSSHTSDGIPRAQPVDQ